MADNLHPLADKFRAKLDALRLLATRLDNPDSRQSTLPQMRAGLRDILSRDPPPSPALCRTLYDVQSNLAKLGHSGRNEYRLAAAVDLALMQARGKADDPPRAG